MENSKLLKAKRLRVLKAAVLGAAFAESVLLFNTLVSVMQEHLSRGVYDFFAGLAFLEAIPSVLVANAIGCQMNVLVVCIVNGLLGSLLFGLLTALWQFGMKDHEE